MNFSLEKVCCTWMSLQPWFLMLYLVFPTAYALIGYFEVTWRLTMKLSRQNLWAGNIAKSIMSKGKRALLPTIVDQRPLFQRGLMNLQLEKFQLYNKSLNDLSFGKQVTFVSRGGPAPIQETLRLSSVY